MNFFLILETIFPEVKKFKKRSLLFFHFKILETLISRIQKIKKTQPMIFYNTAYDCFLIFSLEIIFGTLEGQKLETIIF